MEAPSAAGTPVASTSVARTSGWFGWPGGQTLLSCVLLTVAVVVAYSGVTRNGFLNYDDDRYITDNVHVRAGLTGATAKWAFTTYDEANWAPLSWLSHALDCQLFGLKPAGHHGVNVLLHAVNAVLLFLLLQALLQAGLPAATGRGWVSLMVAALFALHPINVESVAWAAERKNVLSMLFFLLALHCYVWYTRKPGVLRYAGVFCLFALALLSKSQVITFPFLLLLLDYWPLGRMLPGAGLTPESQLLRWKSLPWLATEKVPLLMLSAGSALITMDAEKAGGAVQGFSRYSLPLRLETAVISYVRYLGKALWPAKLVALYPHPTKLYPGWQVAAAAMGLILISALVLRARNKPYLVVGWLWFLGSMVPMIGLVQVGPQAMADRFAYIPFIGLFLMVSCLVADWTTNWNTSWTGVHSNDNKDRTGDGSVPRRWVAIALAGYVAVLGGLTYSQVSYWHDAHSFWRRTLALTEGNYVAENNLADVLFKEGKADEAASHFRAALAIRPDNLLANLNLAAYEDIRGNLATAIEQYQMVILHTADVDLRASAYASLGFDYRALGQPAKARQCFETAVELAPHRTRALVGLGLLAQQDGNWPEAIRQYSRAAAVHPTDVTYLLLAQALQHDQRLEEAKAASGKIGDLAEAQKVADSFLDGK
jgi:tetratricopeptide (TPR) repeat protein